jgi:hypothetical protein
MGAMQTIMRVSLVVCLALARSTPATAQHAQHPLKARGAIAMGFDQEKTRHHFRLTATGGAIEVIVLDRADQALREQVRAHLKEVAVDFAAGRFAKPLATHGELPPGARTMEVRRNRITYTYEAMPDGGRVLIATADRRAKSAVHDFLRYQIREHVTGDSTAIVK